MRRLIATAAIGLLCMGTLAMPVMAEQVTDEIQSNNAIDAIVNVCDENDFGDENNTEINSNTITSSDLSLSSPDGTICVDFAISDNGQLSYQVRKNGDVILEESKLGIRTNLENFSNGLVLESTEWVTYDETYSLPQGKRSQYQDHFNQRKIVVKKGNAECDIYFRAYDDGIAYRYYIPGNGEAVIYEEMSEFNLPSETGGWAFDWRSDYEGLYTYRSPKEFSRANFAMPVLASITNNKHWLLLTEGNVYNANGSYCASHLDGTNGEVMKVAFAPEQTDPIVTEYPFQTPYRVAIITDDLNRLMNSVLVTNLNPKSSIKDTSWIATGKSAWSWWSEERSPQWFDRQQDYVDFAAANGWDFVTVDAGWDDTWVEQLCSYAAKKNVKIVVWTDVDAIDSEEKANEKLTKWHNWGVSGIKVDFMMNDSQMRMNTYQIIAEKAAKLKMLVNFHGSTKPSGEIRTWPHVTTSEAVRGSEHYKWGQYSTSYQNCVLPFTRNVVGPMDFTPTVISNSNLNTTQAHQLALSVIFESGMQHFADSIDTYEAWKGKNFLNKIPVSWDDSRVIDAFPGDYVVMARRSNNDWFVGALTTQARQQDISLDFLDQDGYTAYIYADSPDSNIMRIYSENVNRNSTLHINMSNSGGCAIVLTKDPYNLELKDDPNYHFYEAEAAGNTLTGQAAVVFDESCFGNKKIGNLGGSAGSALTFNDVVAVDSGIYRVKLYYASGEQRNLEVQVNNIPVTNLRLPSTGSYHTLKCVYFDVELKAGTNSITFGGTGYAPDVDRIGIMRTNPEESVIYEAENGTLSGGAYVSDAGGFSGEKKVSYLGKGGELLWDEIIVPQSGLYRIRIYYATDGNRSFMISANEDTAASVICFDSGSFDSTESKDVLLRLQAGSNTLRVYNDSNYAPDIDCVKVYTKPIS